MARAIGIVRRAGLVAVAESRLGPRALWRLWARIRDSGGGVGALVATLVEAGEGARTLVSRDGERPPVEPCPSCGADLRRYGGWGIRGECPSCRASVRECTACEELALAGGPCPWCGAKEA